MYYKILYQLKGSSHIFTDKYFCLFGDVIYCYKMSQPIDFLKCINVVDAIPIDEQ